MNRLCLENLPRRYYACALGILSMAWISRSLQYHVARSWSTIEDRTHIIRKTVCSASSPGYNTQVYANPPCAQFLTAPVLVRVSMLYIHDRGYAMRQPSPKQTSHLRLQTSQPLKRPAECSVSPVDAHGIYATPSEMLALHQFHGREESWSSKAMDDDTLNINVLVARRTPEFQKDVPAGSVPCPMANESLLFTRVRGEIERTYTGGSNFMLTMLLSL